MAAVDAAITTMTSMNTLNRKVHGGLVKGFQFEADEWTFSQQLEQFRAGHSAREVLTAIDLQEEAGVASIPDGGDEARTGSVSPVDASFTWIHLNARYSVTMQRHWIEEFEGNKAQIENVTKYQGMKKVQAMARYYSDLWWGYSTGYLAQTSTAATQASGAYTLLNGYADAAVTNSAFIANKFKVGDYVALIRAGALVTNAIGVVTAVSASTPSITVTWNGSVTSVANDFIVLANSSENTTITGTDYNRGLVGMLDAYTSTSVHGISSATEANWQPSLDVALGGRFNSVHIMRMRHETGNKGGGTMDRMFIAQGVYRDLMDNKLGSVRFKNPMSMEMEGELQAKKFKTNTSRRIPNGMVFGAVSSSMKRWDLLSRPDGAVPWREGDKVQNKSAYVFNLDVLVAQVWLNRANLTRYTTATEQ